MDVFACCLSLNLFCLESLFWLLQTISWASLSFFLDLAHPSVCSQIGEALDWPGHICEGIFSLANVKAKVFGPGMVRAIHTVWSLQRNLASRRLGDMPWRQQVSDLFGHVEIVINCTWTIIGLEWFGRIHLLNTELTRIDSCPIQRRISLQSPFWTRRTVARSS